MIKLDNIYSPVFIIGLMEILHEKYFLLPVLRPEEKRETDLFLYVGVCKLGVPFTTCEFLPSIHHSNPDIFRE